MDATRDWVAVTRDWVADTYPRPGSTKCRPSGHVMATRSHVMAAGSRVIAGGTRVSGGGTRVIGGVTRVTEGVTRVFERWDRTPSERDHTASGRIPFRACHDVTGPNAVDAPTSARRPAGRVPNPPPTATGWCAPCPARRPPRTTAAPVAITRSGRGPRMWSPGQPTTPAGSPTAAIGTRRAGARGPGAVPDAGDSAPHVQ